MHNRIHDFVYQNKITTENQFGFREKICIRDAFSNITNTIYNNLDESNPTITTFSDLGKAFDTVDDKIHLETLNCYSICENVNNLLKSYRSSR